MALRMMLSACTTLLVLSTFARGAVHATDAPHDASGATIQRPLRVSASAPAGTRVGFATETLPLDIARRNFYVVYSDTDDADEVSARARRAACWQSMANNALLTSSRR